MMDAPHVELLLLVIALTIRSTRESVGMCPSVNASSTIALMAVHRAGLTWRSSAAGLRLQVNAHAPRQSSTLLAAVRAHGQSSHFPTRERLLRFRSSGLAPTLYSACSHWLTCAAIMSARRTPQIQCHRPGACWGPYGSAARR